MQTAAEIRERWQRRQSLKASLHTLCVVDGQRRGYVGERPPDAAFVVRFVAARYGMSTLDIRSERKQHAMVRAREIAAYLLYHLTHLAFARIGGHLEKERTTVWTAIRRLQVRMQRNTHVAAEVQRVSADCQKAWALELGRRP